MQTRQTTQMSPSERRYLRLLFFVMKAAMTSPIHVMGIVRKASLVPMKYSCAKPAIAVRQNSGKMRM